MTVRRRVVLGLHMGAAMAVLSMAATTVQAQAIAQPPPVPQALAVAVSSAYKADAQWLREVALAQLRTQFPSLTPHDLELLAPYHVTQMIRQHRGEPLAAHTE